jgi:methylenetetrahydrofolate dehydrogenase (NADP+)/methenyltetrahydrofolate cyclohydrolase
MAKLDGKAISEQIKLEIAEKVDKRKSEGKNIPHLAAVLVGENPASQSYVRNKVRSCEQVGFESTLIRKDDSISQDELIEIVKDLNNNEDIDGFIVQLPLPRHIDPDAVTMAIDPRKDVDGFHPTNFGMMAQGMDTFLPATPFGILMLLERAEVKTSGKHVVVLGRSNIVGTPISILLSRKSSIGNATVTLTHSRTKNLKDILLQADIIVAAIGIPDFVKADMVKVGSVIIDVGINRVEDPSRKRGYRLVGDAAYDELEHKCSLITPVPGGVGPMTVTALLMNTLKACERKES